MHVASHYCFNMVVERRLPTRGEKEERGVVVQAEVEASATNSDGHDIPVFDMSSGDAEDDEREYFPKRNVETAKNKSYTSKVCEADSVKVEVQGVLDDILRRIIGVEAILRGWAGGEDEKRRRRIDEMKEGIARNRLERLEKEEDEEQEQVEDEDFTRCVVRRWMLEMGFGFVETESRENAFLHVSAMSSGEVPKIGSVVFARILVDEPRTDAGKRAVEAHSLQAWREAGEAAGGDSGRSGSEGCQAGRGVHAEGRAECEGAVADAARPCDRHSCAEHRR